ncbi:XRE family transcriptional regulator [Bacteroides sp. AF16-49]|uniref:helix-turn-helix domain-containing protein n=1 Tax=Bacteroides sp. AF16-49 TaxID=2292192 RepID=UPI000EFF5842|nr:helix-turn-helix transcriptional regulator [Bacteroides sp. AF16-49]RHR72424.1 XRE family transcriptional regulator [Bacteroides sp. AF16-49]
MNVGSVVKELMTKQKIEVAELAGRLGKTEQEVCEILNEKDVSSSLIKELSSAFNVPVTIFFDNSTINNMSNTGGSSVIVNRDNNGKISISSCKELLDNALCEIKHLKVVLKLKDELLEEKERLINVLMDK